MNDLVRMAAGVVLLIAVAGIALFVLIPGDEPTETVPIEAPAAPAPEPAPEPPAPAPTPPPALADNQGQPDPAALLLELEALTFDPQAADEDETRAYRTLMSQKTKLYRKLEQLLRPGVSTDEPAALVQLARAKVSMGDLYNQTVLPQGLTAKQSEVYVQTAEKRARASYDEALALLDRAEAADPGLSETALALRQEIQSR